MIDHPNVLKLEHYFEEESFFFIVTEICEDGDV